MQAAIPAMMMRGGTSKGLYFHRHDLPADKAARDRLLLAAMGSPDDRQIDGMGGAHPLTSKVAVIAASAEPGVDVDYLFLQVVVDKAIVSDAQNCGNILAGVGPFAIETGIVEAVDGVTEVRIRMLNSGGLAIATVQTPGGAVRYDGEARIDGVPGSAAPVMLDFADVAGSSCGALLPSGKVIDTVGGVEVTCIDNGMPVVLLRAGDFGKSGYESPADLEADEELKARIEAVRLAAGRLMNLGDVTDKTVPKMTLVAAPGRDGVISTRTFIPHRVHEAIGVLGAASVAAACLIPGTIANAAARMPASPGPLAVEHPTGSFGVDIELSGEGANVRIHRSALLRTARKLMEGVIFVPGVLLN